MPNPERNASIEKEFPGDEALQQVHLAREQLLRAANKEKLTLGAYVRSLNINPKKPAET